MTETLWSFEALDTLFFRDGKPFNAGESTWIDSLFPPTGHTLQGVIRTTILENLGADMAAFARGEPCLPDGKSLKEELGDAAGLGRLCLVGPFLTRNRAPLFPAPLDLVKSGTGFKLLRPDQPLECDLGNVRLPTAGGVGLKVQEGKFVTTQAMEILLGESTQGIQMAVRQENDKTGSILSLFPAEPGEQSLADREPKIGLARENEKRTAKLGMLYSIAPIRPRGGTGFIVGVKGLSPAYQLSGRWVQRLGGEGKLAVIEVGGILTLPATPSSLVHDGRVRFKLVLTTPASLPAEGWLPEGFTKVERDGITVWEGVLTGISVTLVAACVGKPVKIGGWDLANGRPRNLAPFVPAGSVYFCEAKVEDIEKVRALHGTQIGRQVEYGFGHILVGTW